MLFSEILINKDMKSKKAKPTTDQEIIIDMPEVKDIPGQEHVKPPRFESMIDTTNSSAGEEGEGLLDDLNSEESDEITDSSTNISRSEKKLLKQTDRPITEETKDLQKLALDKTDGEDRLNEESDPLDLGEDLDIPGSELDDDDEKIGEEDEENNKYSQPD